MQIDVKVTRLPKDGKNDKNLYDVKLKTYKQEISGRFEHWELRYLIQQIDNAIY
jgi:hypothetical protein